MMQLILGAYDVNQCVLDELLSNDVSGFIYRAKKHRGNDKYYLMFDYGVKVTHVIVIREGQIRSTMNKQQLQALFYSKLGRCPDDVQETYNIKRSNVPLTQEDIDIIYFLVDTCPYSLPVFIENNLYYLSIEDGNVMLDGATLSNWYLNGYDLIHWLIMCNPFNFRESSNAFDTGTATRIKTHGEVELLTYDDYLYISSKQLCYTAAATDTEDLKEVFDVVYHRYAIEGFSYEDVVTILVKQSVTAHNDGIAYLILSCGITQRYSVIKGDDGNIYTDAPDVVLSCIIADELRSRSEMESFNKLPGLVTCRDMLLMEGHKCSLKCRSIIYALMQLLPYSVTFKYEGDYFNAYLDGDILHINNLTKHFDKAINLVTECTFAYSLLIFVEVLEECLPFSLRLVAYERLKDWDLIWRHVKPIPIGCDELKLLVGKINPYLCIMGEGSYLAINTSVANIRDAISIDRTSKEDTLGELLDLYCAKTKDPDYTKVIVNLLEDAGVSERVKEELRRKLSD